MEKQFFFVENVHVTRIKFPYQNGAQKKNYDLIKCNISFFAFLCDNKNEKYDVRCSIVRAWSSKWLESEGTEYKGFD